MQRNPLAMAITGVNKEQLFVPEDDSIVFTDDGDDEEIIKLLAIYKQHGAEALTEDEYSVIAHIVQPAGEAVREGFNSNLAEYLEDSVLNIIAQNVIQWVDWDEQSRSDWQRS